MAKRVTGTANIQGRRQHMQYGHETITTKINHYKREKGVAGGKYENATVKHKTAIDIRVCNDTDNQIKTIQYDE